jgi:Ca2+-binding RTX toxin-like protein
VVGLAGADTLTGNGGNDTLSGDDNDSLTGGVGEDVPYDDLTMTR